MGSKNKISLVRAGFEAEGYTVPSLDVEYKNAFSRVSFLCPSGHLGKMRWNTFQQGSRCKDCFGTSKMTQAEVDRVLSGNRLTLVSMFERTKLPVKCVCDKGHLCTVDLSRSSYRPIRCGVCTGTRKYDLLSSFASEYPELVFLWSKDNTLSPFNISPYSHETYLWVCDRNSSHVWLSSPASIARGRRCSYCAGKSVLPRESLASLKPTLVLEWDYTKNTVSPQCLSVSSSLKVWWACSKGHSWEAPVKNRSLNNTKCPYCFGQAVGYGNDLASYYPLLCEEWDFDKNKLSPSRVRPGSSKKVWWKCSKGHSWAACVYDRTSGNGCPECSGGSISKISQEWLDSLGVEDREVRLKIKTKAFTVDGFDPKTNTVYEFLGDFWHGNPEKFPPEDINPVSKKSFGELYDRTFRRFAKLEEAGYNVVFIWEKEFKELLDV